MFFDWNGNGKKDVGDDFIEYNIYRNSTNSSSWNRKKAKYTRIVGNCSCAKVIIVCFLAIYFILLFGIPS